MNQDELMHFGIKGMKWGVRRYQNSDGSLTTAGRKRYDGSNLSERKKRKLGKKYEKLVTKAGQKLDANKMYLDSWNSVADKMNKKGGGIDKFDKRQEKKYGKNFREREGYDEDLNKLISEKVANAYNKKYYEVVQNKKEYIKAEKLSEKYGMYEWNELAKNNKKEVEKLKKKFG